MADRGLGIGGPTLAAHTSFVFPPTVGRGTSWLPDRLRLSLRPADERGFGTVASTRWYRVSR